MAFGLLFSVFGSIFLGRTKTNQSQPRSKGGGTASATAGEQGAAAEDDCPHVPLGTTGILMNLPETGGGALKTTDGRCVVVPS